MTQPDPIQLDLDTGGYTQGLNQASAATDQFGNTLHTTYAAMTPMQRAMDLITPSRALLAGFAGLAANAANVQQALAPMAATARVTGANMATLSAGMRTLARDIPMGNAGARELVQQLTQLGLAARGSEMQVGQLGKVFGNLGGATNEGPAGLAAGFIQLNRAMGTGFDPGRMSKLSDSLTTVSAKSGASATGILQFAKSIAPMAQSTGIGETKVLGISAAFAKLGDDGLGAGNAFNKMLGDMNRSIREGSPDMASYAQIVGKTTGQFMALTKANPGEAIAQVFEGINRAGPNGPRMLEQLGLDGVRVQRSIQSVAGAGGIRQAMGISTGAYGSGSTAEAAKKAFDGLSDSGIRLRTVTEQLADAMGAPLLGAMTKFTDVLGAGVSPVAKVVGSGPVQELMKVAVAAAIPLILALKLAGPLGTAALGTQAATSGLARGALAGLQTGREAGAVGGRFTGSFIERARLGMTTSDNPAMDRANMAVFRGMQRLGSMMPGGGSGPGMFTQARNLGFAGTGAMMRMQAEQFRAARTGYAERSYVMRPYGQPYEDHARTVGGARAAVSTGLLTEEERRGIVAASRRELYNNVRSQSFGTGLGQTARGIGAMGYEGARFAGSGLSRLAQGAVGMLGTPMMALTAVMGGYQLYSHQKQMSEAQSEATRSNTSFIDDYRVAMGKATEATSTFAGRMKETAESIASGVTSMADALKITPEDVKAAGSVRGHPVQKFSGTHAGVAAQLRLQGNIAPDELTRISYDLINQYGREGAQSILDQVGTGGSQKPTDFAAAAKGIGQGKGAGGFRGFASKYLDIAGGLQDPGEHGSFDYTVSGLSKEQIKGADTIATAINETLGASADKFGQNWANSEARKNMDAAITGALEAGNTDLASQLVHSFQSMFAPNEGTFKISEDQLRKRGFSNIMSAHSQTFASNFAVSGTPVQETQHGYYDTRSQGSGLQALFSGTDPRYAAARGAVNTALTTGIENPADQARAIAAVTKAYTAAGGSLEGLADHAAGLVTVFDNAKDGGNRFAVALNQAAMAAIQSRPTVTTAGGMATTMGERYAHNAAITPTNENDAALRTQGIEGLRAIQEQTKAAMVARLTAQREYQVQSVRSQEDFTQQMTYSETDFQRQMLRNEHDFNRQRAIANRDYARNALHAEQDFQRQRQYAIEDGARAAYSAYQRIAVQQTWDAPNLIGNIEEQAQALQSQLENLATLRRGGASSTLIKLLDLNNPANAQQLASLVGDMANNPAVVQALNSSANKRQSLGQRLMGDPDNTALARQDKEFGISMARTREQFSTTMTDMATNQSTAIARATEDRNIAVGRMTEQNAKMIKRAGEDLARADQEIVGSLTKLSDALGSALKGNFVDFTKTTESSMDKWRELAGRFSGDWKDLVQGLTVNASVSFTATDASGATVDTGNGKNLTPLINASAAGSGGSDASGLSILDALTGGSGGTKTAPQVVNKPKKMAMHAMGGIFTHATHMSQFDTAGEAGPEALIPLNKNGAKMLEDIFGTVLRKGDPIGGGEIPNFRRGEPIHTEWLGQEQSRMMSTAGAATHVHYDSSTHYADHSQTIEQVTVISQDPDDMGKKLMAVKRRNNLTAAPQTR